MSTPATGKAKAKFHEDHSFTGTCPTCGQQYCGAEIDRLRAVNAEMLAALKRAVERADKNISSFKGRTTACQADYDACVAAITKATRETT